MNSLEFIKTAHAERWDFDPETQQPVFEYTFTPTFKEASSLDKSIYFTHYLVWTGKVRELALAEIGVRLANDFSSGQWGLVTNWADLKVVDETFSYQPLLAVFRIGKVYQSVIPLSCEFYKVVDDKLQLVAVVSQETTWVEIIGHGKVKPAAFPEYLEQYLEKNRQRTEISFIGQQAKGAFSDSGAETNYFKTPVLPGGLPVVDSTTFLTTLEDANLVGNVYYANYFIWQGRLRDQFINKIAPQYLCGTGIQGAFVCTHAHLDYLRDAMPFENIFVTFSFQEITDTGVVLRFEYFRDTGNGNKEKLAVGEHVSSWVTHAEQGQPLFTSIPDEIMTAMMSKVSTMTKQISA
jgi:acyl-CoA thioesterase FadM